MRSVAEALESIAADYRAMCAAEGNEAALSTNKPWITASKVKIKRDAPTHLPIEGEPPETYASLTAQSLHNVATVIKARRIRMERGAKHTDMPPGSPEYEARRKGALAERNVPALEVAFLFGYARESSLRELRIRNGLDENEGTPLKDSQRPIISDRKRARRT